jgi:exoribonuclease R
MADFTVQIHSRNYDTWSLTTNDTEYKKDAYNPLTQKHFHGDVIDDVTLQIIHSPLREKSYLAGILVLENNKTYGRTENKKRLLYKCIPDKKHYPAFLVPYEPKMGFSKNIHNQYVIFKYKHWEEKHPRGELLETFGPTDDFQAFEKYQLHCKEIPFSIKKLHTHVRAKFKEHDESYYLEKIITANPHIEDRTREYVFTIDNEDTTDYDDAISITQMDTQVRISVYITNVAYWMEVLDAWNVQKLMAATIYLKNKKYPMLPSEISEDICSLTEKKERIAMYVDFIYDTNHNMVNTHYGQALVHIKKNFRYDTPKLLNNEYYQSLYQHTNQIQKIEDSHELIAYWMVETNKFYGKILYGLKCGIFRKTNIPFLEAPRESIGKREMFLYIYTHKIRGEYERYNENNTYNHALLNADIYCHITSPLRRLSDMENMKIINNMHKHISSITQEDILKMNEEMRKIRKVEKECQIVNLEEKEYDAEVIEKTTSGYILHISKCMLEVKTNEIMEGIQKIRIRKIEKEGEVKKKVLIERII